MFGGQREGEAGTHTDGMHEQGLRAGSNVPWATVTDGCGWSREFLCGSAEAQG